MIDNSKALVVYNPKRKSIKQSLCVFFSRISTACARNIKKHFKTVLILFLEYIFFNFLSACVSFSDYAAHCKIFIFCSEIHQSFHLLWITALFFSGFTIYGRFTVLISNAVISFGFGVIWVNYASKIDKLLPIIAPMMFLSFLSLYFHSCVFDYSKKAFKGWSLMFKKCTLIPYSILGIIYLFFTFLFSLLIFNS